MNPPATPSVRSGPSLWLIVSGCLLLSLCFFSPHLWLMRAPTPGSTVWARGLAYLAQCEQPFRPDVETAMQWRLLPPLVAHALGLRGFAAFVLPWLGVIAAAVFVARLLRERLPDWRFVAGGTLLYATTSATLAPVGWLGLNDGWVWLGLLAVAFGRSAWTLPLACLLCPWVDERFIIGFPLAWIVRSLDRQETWLSPAAWSALWLLPYAALRLALGGNPATNQASAAFLVAVIPDSISLAGIVPRAWWLGLRAAWFAVAFAAWVTPPRQRLAAAVVLAATLVVTWLLASDLTRSIAIVVPAVLLGCTTLARRFPLHAPRVLLALGVANLFIPAAHVVYKSIDPISPLPLELWRLLR